MKNIAKGDVMKFKRTILVVVTVALVAIIAVVVNGCKYGKHANLESLDWVKRGPVKIVALWGGDSGESAFLLKNKPGYTGKKHTHSADYHGVTLQGVWLKTMGDGTTKELPVGSHIMQKKDEMHIDGCKGPHNCILFIHFEGTRDITFAKE